MFWLIVAVVAFLLVAKFHLSAPSMAAFDKDTGERFAVSSAPEQRQDISARLQNLEGTASKGNPFGKAHIRAMRELMDGMFSGNEFDATFTSTTVGNISAEWVLAPGVDSKRRVLYIHGGAFTMGSPLSHRAITSQWSKLANAAVLAIDYRLMPEHKRIAGVEDCRKAYQWLLTNGPDGEGEAASIYVSGDSAGGNLTLSTIAWVRDQGLRQPNGAVALSPLTDSTMINSPSMRDNIPTDPMLGPIFGKIAKLPNSVLLWFGWINNRINPTDPVVSPLLGNLAGLPPVLIQASSCEMLVDDARRYVNKAQSEGSDASLQLWDEMVHVWQIFNPDLDEAVAAFAEIEKFVKQRG